MFGAANPATGAPGGYLGFTAASHAVSTTAAWGCADKCTQFSDTKRVVDAALAAPAPALWTPIMNWAQLNVTAVALYNALAVASDYTGPDHTFTTWVAFANGDYIVAVDCRSLSSWTPCLQAPRGTTFVLGAGIMAYNGARNVVSWFVLQSNGLVQAGISSTPDLGGGKGAMAFDWYNRAVSIMTGTWTPTRKSAFNAAVNPIATTDASSYVYTTALAVPVYNNASLPVLLGVVAGEKNAPAQYVCGDACKMLDFAPRAASIAALTLPLSPMPATATILAALAAAWLQAGDGLSARPLALYTPTGYFEAFPCTILPSAPDCAMLPPGAVSYRVMQPAVFGDNLLRAFKTYSTVASNAVYTWTGAFALPAAVTASLQSGGWTGLFTAWGSMPGAGSNVDAFVLPAYAPGSPATWLGSFLASRVPSTSGCGSSCASGGAARRIARAALSQLSADGFEALRSGKPLSAGGYSSPLSRVVVALLSTFAPSTDATQLRPLGVSVTNWGAGQTPVYVGLLNCRAASGSGVPACRTWPAAPWIVEVLNEAAMSAAYWPVDGAGRLASAVATPLTVSVPASVPLPSTSAPVQNAKSRGWRAGQQQTPGCLLASWPTYADKCLVYGATLIDGPTASLVGVALGSQDAFPSSCGDACLINSFARRGAAAMAGVVSAALTSGAGIPYTTANTWADVRAIGLSLFATLFATSPGAQPYLQISVGGARDDSYLFLDCSYQPFYAACVLGGPQTHYIFAVANNAVYGDMLRHVYALTSSAQFASATQSSAVQVTTGSYSGKNRPSWLPNGGWVTAPAFSLTGAPVTSYTMPVYVGGTLACVTVGSLLATAPNPCGNQCTPGSQGYAGTAAAAAGVAAAAASVAGLSASTAVRPLTSAMIGAYSSAYVPAGLWVGASGVDAAIVFACSGPPGAFIHAWGSVCGGGAKGVAGIQVLVGASVSTSFYAINMTDGTPMTSGPALLTTTMPLLSASKVAWVAANPLYVGPFVLDVSVASLTVSLRFDRILPQYASGGGAYSGSVMVSSLTNATCASGCANTARTLADSIAALALSTPAIVAQATANDVLVTATAAAAAAAGAQSPLAVFTTVSGTITGAINCGVLPGGCPSTGLATPGMGVVSNAPALGGPARSVLGYGPIPDAGGIVVGASVATGIVADGTTLPEYTVSTGATLDAVGTSDAVWSTLAGSPTAALGIASTAVFSQDLTATPLGVASVAAVPCATCYGNGSSARNKVPPFAIPLSLCQFAWGNHEVCAQSRLTAFLDRRTAPPSACPPLVRAAGICVCQSACITFVRNHPQQPLDLIDYPFAFCAQEC